GTGWPTPPARSATRCATSSAACRRGSSGWPRRSGSTGGSRTGCIGCWMSPSMRTGCGNATATGSKTWRCSIGWRCHSCARTKQSRQGSNASAKPRAGMTATSSDYCSIVNNPSALAVVVEGTHDFLDGRELVPDVQPVKVDVIGLQPPETGVHREHHALAVVACGVGIVAGSGIGVLGRQHDPVAMAGHELAEQRCAGAVGVNVGSINEVAARFPKGVVDLAALVF